MKNISTIVLIIILILVVSCSQNVGNNEVKKPGQKYSDSDGEIYNFEDNLEWPEYIPTAIPKLKGNVSLVLADNFSVRIFLNDLAENALKDYIDTMKNSGFDLKYIVYVQEGFKDNSEERKKRGEFDAVKFSKGNYRVAVEAGMGSATVDIDVSGFSQKEKEVMNRIKNPVYVWPDNLTIPQPMQSKVKVVGKSADGSTFVSCSSTGGMLLTEYLDVLINKGYKKTEQNKDQTGRIMNVTLIKDETAVKLSSDSFNNMDIRIWSDGSYVVPEYMHPQVVDGNWPISLPGTIPPFTEGTVDTALNTGGDSYTIIVTAGNDKAYDNYISLLMQNGFKKVSNTDSSRYSNGEYEIVVSKLMMSSMITIKISKL